MKVLHVGKYFPPRYGGIETFMSQLMEEQANQGNLVSAIVHADTLQSERDYYQWKNCKVYEVKSYGQLVFAPLAPLYPWHFYQALKKEKPDIIHVHLPNLSAFWVLIFKKYFAKNAKIIIHWHADVLGSSPTKMVRLLYPFYRCFERSLVRMADNIITTSPPYLETSEPLKEYREKCLVVPLGIKIKDFDSSRKKTREDGVLRLCMIGRLVYYKGHSLVLKALKKLVDMNVNVTLDVIGSGELNGSLRQSCEAMGLDKVVKWHGAVEESLKLDILKNADLLVLPSIERTEAFGVVILEAAALKTPALVSDVEGSGMQYVVRNGKTGIVCPNNDEDGLVLALLDVVSVSQKLIDYGEEAYLRLTKSFNIKIIAEQIHKVYCR